MKSLLKAFRQINSTDTFFQDPTLLKYEGENSFQQAILWAA